MSDVQLKILIAILFALMILSLFDGLYILFKDEGAPASKRLFHRLVIRVCLALALLTTMAYGVYSGKLHSAAPWHRPGMGPAAPTP